MKHAKIIIPATLLTGLIVYLIFRARKARANDITRTEELKVTKTDWQNKKFEIKSPFGRRKVSAVPYNEQLLNESQKHRLSVLRQPDLTTVTLEYKDPESRVFIEQIVIDFVQQEIYPTSLTRQEFDRLTNGAA